MAKLSLTNQLPYEVISQLEELEKKSDEMFGQMTQAGAQVAYKKVVKNMKKAFKHSDEIINNLKVTKAYKTPSDMGINTKVAVYGYIKKDKNYQIKNTYKGTKGKYYSSKGIATDFVVKNREFGNSRGEAKKPIFRTAFNKKDIEEEMLKVQNEFLPKD